MIPDDPRTRQDGPVYLPKLQPDVYLLAPDQPAWQCVGTEDLLTAYMALRPSQVCILDGRHGRLAMN